MMIDIHTHVFSEHLWNTYQKKSKKLVSKIISIPYFNKESKDIPKIPDIEELLEFTDTHPNVYALGSIDMDDEIEKQLARHEELLKEGRIVGIKLYPGYQHFYPYEKKVIKIAQLCEKYNKPLVFHSGDLFDPDNKAILKYSHPIHIDELARKCPKTKIIISHFGFPYYMETTNVATANDNVYVDISAIVVEFSTSKETRNLQKQCLKDLQRVFTYYPLMKEKVMLGTDFGGDETPLSLVKPYIKIIKKFLNKSQQENAFHKLAEKLYFN
ncbi:MAG: Amidohydrolase family protein [uncultured bacterium]|nr:MAG: Amidohydrolase family protein [uncultured bacterium]HBR79187.1 hypothetical protein [Candidatus Moranbacteria bacterium]